MSLAREAVLRPGQFRLIVMPHLPPGRSKSGILVLMVDETVNRASLLLWQSRRQTLTALSAPEAEVVALSVARHQLSSTMLVATSG